MRTNLTYLALALGLAFAILYLAGLVQMMSYIHHETRGFVDGLVCPAGSCNRSPAIDVEE